MPDLFTGFDDGATADDYYPLCEHSRLFEQRLELHPQYVLENGVDFAHFKFVHQVPIVPIFTRQEFDEPISYVDFTITFDDADAGGSIEDINSGVNAINCGLGLAVTKTWGMIDNRTASAITPVDDSTCDVRFSVWIGRKPGDDRDHSEAADKNARGVIEQFEADIEIWSHQKYAEPGRAVARRVPRLHRPAPVGRAVLSGPDEEPRMTRPIRVFQVATGNVGSEMIKRLGPHPDLELVGVHCYSPDKIGRDVGELAGIDPVGITATGTVEEIIAAKPDVVTFHGVFPDEDLYVQVLEAGINIVTTADWITGFHRDTNHPHPSGRRTTEVLQEACERGGSTFYGTGMNPGLNQILGRRLLRRRRRHRERHHDRVGRRVLPPLRRHLARGRLRPARSTTPSCRRCWRSTPRSSPTPSTCRPTASASSSTR